MSRIKMGKEILTFGDIENEKNKFYQNETPVPLKDVDIEKVLVSNKVSFGKKTINALQVTCIMIIKLKPLHIILPKTSAYVKSYDG